MRGRAVIQDIHEDSSELANFVASNLELATKSTNDFEEFALSSFNCFISPWCELDRKLAGEIKKSGDLGKLLAGEIDIVVRVNVKLRKKLEITKKFRDCESHGAGVCGENVL